MPAIVFGGSADPECVHGSYGAGHGLFIRYWKAIDSAATGVPKSPGRESLLLGRQVESTRTVIQEQE